MTEIFTSNFPKNIYRMIINGDYLSKNVIEDNRAFILNWEIKREDAWSILIHIDRILKEAYHNDKLLRELESEYVYENDSRERPVVRYKQHILWIESLMKAKFSDGRKIWKPLYVSRESA